MAHVSHEDPSIKIWDIHAPDLEDRFSATWGEF